MLFPVRTVGISLWETALYVWKIKEMVLTIMFSLGADPTDSAVRAFPDALT